MNKDEYFYVTGLKYGYPKCCIKEFIERYNKRIFNTNRKLVGTGYIPCIYCHNKYTIEELINNINKNRSKDLEKFMESKLIRD